MALSSHDRLQIAGFVGVIIGLVLVAVEVRQANKIALASTEISIRENYIAFHTSTLENEYVAMLLVKAQDPEAVFSALEEERVYAFVALYINNWIAIETAHRHGMIPQASMDIVFDDIASMLDYYKALGPYFRDFLAEFPSAESFEFAGKLNELTG